MPDPAAKRVLLVDDHPIVRAGLKSIIEREYGLVVCGEAGSAQQARTFVAAHKPDLAVVDLILKNEDGLTLVGELRRLHPPLQVLVISMLDEKMYADRALNAGAAAYLHKDSGLDAVGPILRQLAARRSAEDGRPVRRWLSVAPKSGAQGVASLSNRELQVFQLIGLGRATREIAAGLGVSVKTVETHRENIKTKLGVDTSVALIGQASLWVREQGLMR